MQNGKDPMRTVIHAQYTLKSINIFNLINVFCNIKFAGFFLQLLYIGTFLTMKTTNM